MAKHSFHTMRLTYFDGNGRVDPVRLALRICEIPFEDERVQLQDWVTMRDSGDRDLPLGQLPTLTVNTTVYCQSMAQLRFVGRLGDLYPVDPLVQLCVDEIVDSCQEVLNRAPNARDDNTKRALREARLASAIATHGPNTCSAGPDLSIADLALYALCRLITLHEFDHVPATFVDAVRFPAIATVLRTIQQHPKMQAFAGDFLLTTSKEGANVEVVPGGAQNTNGNVASASRQVEAGATAEQTDDAMGPRATAPPTLYRTWADDSALGKTCPALASLTYIHRADQAASDACALRVLVFWASYADGDFGVLHDVSTLCAQPQFRDIHVVGVSCDTVRENADAFLSRIGTPVADLKIAALSVNFPLAFDAAKSFRSALRTATGLLAVGVSMVFVVDKTGTIVWREQFSQTHPVGDGQLAMQLQRLVDGKPLVSNGPRPAATDEVEAEEEEDGTDVDSADSDGLML